MPFFVLHIVDLEFSCFSAAYSWRSYYCHIISYYWISHDWISHYEDHIIEDHIIALNIILLKIILLKIILLAPLLRCFFSSVAIETLLPRQDFLRISAALFSQQMPWRKVQSNGFWSFKRNNDIETKGSPKGWVPDIGSDLEECQDTGKHNDRGGEQAFCADVEDGVIAVVMICTVYNGYSIF